MAVVSLQLCILCLGCWLIVSPGVATEQEEVIDADQSKPLVQQGTVANGKNSKENRNDHESSKSSSDQESPISSSSTKLRVILPLQNQSKWRPNNRFCDIQQAMDTARAMAGHRMSLETILRICSIRNGFLTNRKLASTRVLRRIARAVLQPQDSMIYFNNPKSLKRIQNLLRMESKMGTENHAISLGRLPKVAKRSVNDFADGDNIPTYKAKRQVWDRIDEPSEWRDKLQPKYTRPAEKRQVWDRIDEPSEWRDKLQPKYTRSSEKRQVWDRIDEPSEWRDKLQPKYTRSSEKRQVWDRIDEPSEWRDKLQPKYTRSSEKRQVWDRIDEPSEWRDKLQPKYTRPSDKRQVWDRIDEPSEWRDKLQPKYTRPAEKRQVWDRIDEPSEWRDKLQPKYTRSSEKRQVWDRIDEPSEWRDKLQPKYTRPVEKRHVDRRTE